MSLINDALKRARVARPVSSGPTSPNLPFRPVETGSQPTRRSLGLLLPVCLAAVGLLTLLLLWELSKRDTSATTAQPKRQLAVAARNLPSSEAAPTTTETSALPSSAPSAAAASAPAKPGTESAAALPANSTNPSPAGVPAAAGTNSVATDSGETHHAPATESSPPTPAPLKLQSIVFNPRRPSAMLNGHVLFVGDRIRDLRVMSIHRDYVMLVGPGRTNVLSLEP